jgi:monoamine oxidase
MAARPADLMRTVICVGAGPAGLACACALAKAGVRVTLLEAAERVGGRVATVELPGLGKLELGAEWLHGTQGNVAHARASQFGLLDGTEVADAHDDGEALWLCEDARKADAGAIAAVQAEFWRAYDGGLEELAQADDRSVGDVLARAWRAAQPSLRAMPGAEQPLLDSAWRWALRLACAIDGCDDLAREGLVAARYEQLEGGDVRIPGGFSRLPDALARSLVTAQPGCISLSRKVVGIDWASRASTPPPLDASTLEGSNFDGGGDAERVLVHCADGQTFSAHAVVLATPLTALRQICFQPPLPARKLAAADSLELGAVEKIFVTLRRTPPSAHAPDASAPSAGECSAVSAHGSYHFLWTEPELSPRAAEGAGAQPARAVPTSTMPAGAEGARAPSDGSGSGCHEGPAWPRGLFQLARAGGGALPGVLVGWLTGDEARAVSGRASSELTEELRAGLAPFWQQLRSEPVACHVTGWSANCLFGGSYSFPLPHALDDVADVLAEPLSAGPEGPEGTRGAAQAEAEAAAAGDAPTPGAEPRLLFCGEATSRTCFGTVHGALESGEREAARLLRAWGLEPVAR